MKLEYGKGKSASGPGVNIILDGDDIAKAIDLYLYAQNVHVRGTRTIHMLDEAVKHVTGNIFVDPSGYVITPSGNKMEGKGIPKTPMTFNKAFNEWRDEHASETIEIKFNGGGGTTQMIGESNMSEIYDCMYKDRKLTDILHEKIVHANEWN
jgi:hypothetical protein